MNDQRLTRLATILLLSPFVVFPATFLYSAIFIDVFGSDHALHVFFQTFFTAVGVSIFLFVSGVMLSVYLSSHSVPKALLVLLAFMIIIGVLVLVVETS